ncbi:MAG: glycosyltransferase family 2 protein [Acutalibacteraceae bacterium]
MEIEKGLISVIMTNYNTPEEYLREAIDSILNQTYSNFEFIIVDDCSSDDSLSVIESYHDTRIKVLRNTENIGLTKSLNKALNVAKGEFIARMDSDDISEPQRFQKQVDFLSEHEEVIVCGTWAKFFGEWKEERYTHETICREIPDRETFRIFLMFGNFPNIVHSSAMFNNILLNKYQVVYKEQYIYAQDYRMWVECSKYTECAIIPEVLMNIRIRQGTISTSKKEIQNECAINIMREQLECIGLTLSDDNEKYHAHFLSRRHNYDIGYLNWIKKIITANNQIKAYNQIKLESILYKKWAETVYFGLKGCSLKEKIKRLKTLPLKYYPELIKIFLKRRKG